METAAKKTFGFYLRRYIEIPIFLVIYAILTVLSSLGIINTYIMQVAQLACIYIIMAESLNILNGMTGLSSLGQAGFMSVGAYVSAIITSHVFPNIAGTVGGPFAFIAVTIIGAVLAAIVGVLLGMPALRLRGDYLAIVTLGMCEVIRALWRIVPKEVAGGAFGLTGIPKLGNFGWAFLLMIIVLFYCRNYMDSSFGRACIAIRDNEVAADAMGINCFKYKTIAFGTSAFIAGIAGALYAHVMIYVHPDVFSYAKSSDFLVYLYAGGVGSISGAAIGAFCLTILPEILRFLEDWRLVIYGALLLFIILYRPTGIFGGHEFGFLKLKTGGIKVVGFNIFKKKEKKAKKETEANAK